MLQGVQQLKSDAGLHLSSLCPTTAVQLSEGDASLRCLPTFKWQAEHLTENSLQQQSLHLHATGAAA